MIHGIIGFVFGVIATLATLVVITIREMNKWG